MHCYFRLEGCPVINHYFNYFVLLSGFTCLCFVISYREEGRLIVIINVDDRFHLPNLTDSDNYIKHYIGEYQHQQRCEEFEIFQWINLRPCPISYTTSSTLFLTLSLPSPTRSIFTSTSHYSMKLNEVTLISTTISHILMIGL